MKILQAEKNFIIICQTVSDLIPNTKNDTEYTVYDLFREEGKDVLFKVKAQDQLKLKVTRCGGSRMVKLVPQ